MSMTDVIKADSFEQMDRVVQGWMKYGADSAAVSQISREYSIPRKQVMSLIAEWREIYRNSASVQERAQEAIQDYEQTISIVKKELFELMEDARDVGDIKTRATVLKHIADIESKRQETLQKAGIYDGIELGDQLAETQEKVKAISKLLTDVAQQYPEAKTFILEGLQDIFGKSPMVEMPMVQDVNAP